MANVDKLRAMIAEAEQRGEEEQEEQNERMSQAFSVWLNDSFSEELRDVLELTQGWDDRVKVPCATFKVEGTTGSIFMAGAPGKGSVKLFNGRTGSTQTKEFSSEDAFLRLLKGWLVK
jgi:hypothetical protein